jgi:hypothetical protein
MLNTTPPPQVNPLLALLFRASPVLAPPASSIAEADLLLQKFIDERVAQALARRSDENERNRLVDSKEAGALILATSRYVLKLHKNGNLPGRRTPGTRHIYFLVGDLKDWLANNTRADDGARKYTKRSSAPGAKKKGD